MRPWIVLVLLVGCARARPDTAALAPGNILLVVIDDVGAYDVHGYRFSASAPRTPTLDALAKEGVTFTRAWSNPLCSPSRASLMTGLYPFRTGVGDNLPRLGRGFALSPHTPTIASWLRDEAGYATAAVGKWHLSTDLDPQGATPLAYGFDAYVGQPTNLLDVVAGGEIVHTNYTRWHEWRDGYGWNEGYLTETEVDDAIEMTATLPSPWFVYTAVHAAHLPLDLPPAAEPPRGGWTGRARYEAIVEALDAELARLLDAVPEDTTVVVVGDNGAPNNLTTPDFEGADTKGSVMEGGVRVPLIVRSPWVARPGSKVDALTHLVDLLPTLADLAHAPVDGTLELDGRSFAPRLADPAVEDAHAVIFTERFEPGGDPTLATTWERAIRDARYKLVRVDGADACFDLGDGLHEGRDLLGGGTIPSRVRAACADLAARLDAGAMN